MKVKFIYALLLLVASSTGTYAQLHISKADSMLIERYRYRLNKELIIDDVDKKDRNNRTVIDSLIGDSKSRYNGGSVCYSPGKIFKVFVLTGESCSVNCTYMNIGYIYLIKERKTVQASLFPIEKIYKLDGEKYLIIQKGLTDGGIYLSDVLAATVLSINKGKIVYYPIHYSGSITKSESVDADQNGSLLLRQYQNIDDNLALCKQHRLSFDPSTKKLNYSYILDTDHASDKREIYHLSGYFKYENGAFIHKYEKREVYAK